MIVEPVVLLLDDYLQADGLTLALAQRVDFDNACR
jgi:hypothetical protein